MYKLLLASILGLVLAAGLGQSASNLRAYTAGKYALDLDGLTVGFLAITSGGDASAEVIDEPTVAGAITKKHLAGVKYENISLSCGAGMGESFYNWMKDSFDHKYARKNGAVLAADYDFKELSRLTFTNGIISEIKFPALDASSKDAAKMTIKFDPESTQRVVKPGNEVTFQTKGQKKWLPSNFRLRIDGLDDSTSRVNKIDSLTFKMKVVTVVDPRGESHPAVSVEIPNLVITLAESHAQPFYDWLETFVILGKNTDDQEKGGTLEYLAADLKTVLFTLTFSHLGIFKVSPDKAEAGSEQIRRVKIEMYCEDVKFTYGAGALP